MTTHPQVEEFRNGVSLALSGELDAYDAPSMRSAFA